MKLIGPDLEDSPPTNVQDSPLSKLPKKTLSELSLMKSRSRENIARLEDNVSAEVSYHMARPATVVSNNSNNSNISNNSNNSGGSVAGSPAITGEASTTSTNTGGGMNLEW